MRFIGFLAISLFAFADTAWSQSASCHGVENQIQDIATDVKKNFKERDVAPDVENIERLVTTCKVNIAKFGWGRGLFDYWKNTGYEAEVDKEKEQLEQYSNFRDVSPELARYKKYASLLKVNPQEINSYYSKYRNQGLASARAEEKKCQPVVDLRNEALGEVRDQDSVGWCYAFAAADLLTYKLGKKISALDIALTNNNSWINNLFLKLGYGEQDMDGGWAPDAVKNIKAAGGVCLEDKIKSQDNGYGSLFSALSTIHNYKKTGSQDRSANCSQAVRTLFPGIDDKLFSEIAERSSQSSIVKMLQENACKKRINIDGINVRSTSAYFESGRKELFDVMDEQLGKRKNIVAISYNAELLYDRHYNGKLGGHASTVVGRRYNSKNGECEYLIRNSYGRGCSGYDPYLTCEEGNVWIPKSILVKGIRNVNYVE